MHFIIKILHPAPEGGIIGRKRGDAAMETARASLNRDSVYLEYKNIDLTTDLLIDHIGYTENLPDAHTDMDRREHHILHYVTHGKGVFTCKGVDYPMRQGYIYLFPKNCNVSYRADHADPWAVFYAGFYGGKSDYFMQQLGLSEDQLALPREPDDRIPACFQLMIQEAHRANASRTMLAGYFYQLIGTLMHDVEAPKDLAMPLDLLQAIVNHIHSNLDRPLRVHNIASTFHISQSQLFRIFQAKYGRSPRQYIEDVKIESACRLIRNTQCSFREVALKCGYEYESHFYKAFCKKMGMTPSKFRASR